MKLPTLPPKTLTWSTASSLAASISYADRGTSAIAASSLLDQLHWTESQLGGVQSSFFVGYAITQVFGGVLGGRSAAGALSTTDNVETTGGGGGGGYRTVLSASLFFTGLTTLLFPLVAMQFGHIGASVDRFVLGLFEGLLLPAAMAGVGDTVNSDSVTSGTDESYKATASSLVIAGCYLGSAWAYLSAYILFSEKCQTILIDWGFTGEIWPALFYFNGILSLFLLWAFRGEFNLMVPNQMLSKFGFGVDTKTSEISRSTEPLNSALEPQDDIWKETISISKECFGSKSGRAILAAQIGQGALLYSIASWGPLYLERIGAESTSSLPEMMYDASPKSPTGSVSQVATTASKAAYSLIPSQITQALVGVSIGAAADQLSNRIGTQVTRRSLQLLSGVGPALILQYLALRGDDFSTSFASPAFLFGLAQTISALSLGAVSVSHLDIAVPSASGAVYALGNVMAAMAGSAMVNLFGWLLEEAGENCDGLEMNWGQAFAIPFQAVAILSAAGSLFYALTVETELEIGVDMNITLITP
ncbi:hypothetical protein HJC23_000217 [Cyclotella cryptica]|uniref:Uncharacterized protein n=1 Tax=Cyclotella cryptica TaxID=29204 RepID=A0ABD3PLD6_9STRA|eukprot:CCRYP_013386-RA/>CCRYP_013386-RA protein AED:0.01 eAED:-0.00 QI:0/-1/0/1/-1/1/1/0/532